MTQNLLSSFSEEWQELMRIFLLFPNPLQKARNWLERKCFAAFGLTTLSSCATGQRKLEGIITTEKPPSWDELFEDLQEEIPLIMDKLIVYKSRFFLLPNNAQRNLLLFLSENTQRIDSKLTSKFGSFLMGRIEALDLWVQRIAWKYCGSYERVDTSYRNEGINFEKPVASTSNKCDNATLGNSTFMSTTAVKYLDELKETSRAYNAKGNLKLPYQSMGSATVCFGRKLDKDNIISTKKVAEKVEKSFEIISVRLEKEENSNVEQDIEIMKEVAAKRPKLELLDIIDIDDDDDLQEQNLQILNSKIVLDSVGNALAAKSCEPAHDLPKPGSSKQSTKSLSFKDILENTADVMSICLKVNELFIRNNDNIDDLCNGLQLSDLSEEQLCIFMECMGCEKLNLSTLIIKKLLKEAVFKFLMNSDKAISRAIYSHLSDLIKTSKNAVIHSILVALITQSKDNSFQEEFFLKILTSDVLEKDDYSEVLNALLSISRTDVATRLNNSSMKALEIIFNKKIPVAQFTLSELAQVMERSSELLEDSKVLPKVIMLLAKHYKGEIIQSVDRLIIIVEKNTTFLKKIALRDLKKMKLN
eukprot:Seg733.8 transcript_id=Seg733.8/GoldUCD/mRNA.D3Y31 product="hypothetical protein" protein_id=Seg733.8/GoldUCD/D3Y31